MDKDKAKQYLRYLEDKYTEWYTHPKRRSKISGEIYEAAMQWDDEIYNYLSPNNATGLFEHGFFESDIQEAFEKLRAIIDEDKTEQVNKFYTIYKQIEDYKPAQEDVVRKELRDYLLEKIHNGNLKGLSITFRDKEDLEYFTKLASNIGVDSTGLLENILQAFKKENDEEKGFYKF